MMCLVQSFQQAKEVKAKPSKVRKLPFLRRRKPSPVSELQDENLLHPNSLRESSSSFWRQDKGLKHLSGSAPSMTCTPLDHGLTPSTCRSRQKKFLRHFKVDPDERVIDYYSCALVADILLQGHLYISKNFFAFYSNVFGYVTKLLIPISSVISITKEKTAYILPNAVGVTTSDDRHVFSSLLSRDTTHRLMVHVWRTALASPPSPSSAGADREGLCEESSSLSGSESVFDLHSSPKPGTPLLPKAKETSPITVEPNPTTKDQPKLLYGLSRSTVLLAVSTTLLLALFLSAAVLMYRLSQLQHSLQSHPSRSLYEVQEFLDTNLNNLYKVRQSLEALSVMIDGEKEKLVWRTSENNDLNNVQLGSEDSEKQTMDLSAS